MLPLSDASPDVHYAVWVVFFVFCFLSAVLSSKIFMKHLLSICHLMRAHSDAHHRSKGAERNKLVQKQQFLLCYGARS